MLFLGTPHFGTGLATVAMRLAQIFSPTSGTNLRILEVLRRDSEVLSRIQNEFHSLLRSRGQEEYQPIKVTCFYEEVSIAGIGEASEHIPILDSLFTRNENCEPQSSCPDIIESSCTGILLTPTIRLFQNTQQFYQDTQQLEFIATTVTWQDSAKRMIQDL